VLFSKNDLEIFWYYSIMMTTTTENIQIGDERFRKVQIEKPNTDLDLAKLEKFYDRHRKAVKKYQEKNKEQLKEKQKKYLSKLKDDKDRYEEHLEKRRNYYNNVLVPRKKKILEEKHEAKKTTLVI